MKNRLILLALVAILSFVPSTATAQEASSNTFQFHNEIPNYSGLPYIPKQANPNLPPQPNPTLSGEPTVGKALELKLTGWDPTIYVTYAWYCGGQGMNWKNQSFAIPGECVGTTVRGIVFGEKTGFSRLAYSVESAIVAPAPAVRVTGLRLSWNLLTNTASLDYASVRYSNVALWSGSPTARWFRDGVEIPGATDVNYSWTDQDAGRLLHAEYTFSRLGYMPRVGTTPKGLLPGSKVLIPSVPSFTGDNQTGSLLKITPMSDIEAGVTWAFQWLRNGQAITGQNSDTYLVASQDAGQAISFRVTATKDGFSPVTKDSVGVTIRNSTPISTPGQNTGPINTPGQNPGAVPPTKLEVSLSGSGQVGTSLLAITSTVGVSKSITFEWFRDGVQISVGDKQNYILTKSDLNRVISVRAFVVDDYRKFLESTSQLIRVTDLSNSRFTPVKPVIVGKFKTGTLVSTQMSSWGVGVRYSYQWLRDGKAIVGASGKTYLVQTKDKGRMISLKVTGVSSNGDTRGLVSTSKKIG